MISSKSQKAILILKMVAASRNIPKTLKFNHSTPFKIPKIEIMPFILTPQKMAQTLIKIKISS